MIDSIKYNLKTIWDYYSGYRHQFLIVSFIMSISSILAGVGLAFFIPVFEKLQKNSGGEDPSSFAQYTESVFSYFGVPLNLGTLLILVGILFTLKYIFQGLSNIYKSYVVNRFMRNVQGRVFDQVLQSEWGHQINLSSGFLLDDLIGQIRKTRDLYSRILRTISTYTTVAAYSLICLFISYKVTLIGITAAMVVGLAYFPLLRVSKRFGQDLKQANQKFSDLNSQFINGFKEIKLYNSQKEVSKQVHQQAFDIFKYKFYNSALSKITQVITQSTTILFVLGYIYVSVRYFDLNIAEVGVISLLFWQIFQKATAFGNFSTIVNKVPAIEKIRKTLGEAKRNRESLRTSLKEPQFENVIDAEDISFSFNERASEESSSDIIRRISFKVHKGDMIGICGPSGGGKTTLLNLIMGLLKPTQGKILIDKEPLKQLNLRKWREMIGFVPQKSFLLNATIRANIDFFRNVSDKALKKSAEMSHSRDFIDELPDGFETLVGEDGVKLSGGQRQRIALARALAGNPELLILDEATSELDSHSESIIKNALYDIHGEITMITVAHRLSTILDADQILVLEDGQIKERGNSQKLRSQNGVFEELYTQQVMS